MTLILRLKEDRKDNTLEGDPPVFQLAHDSLGLSSSNEESLIKVVARIQEGDAAAFTRLYQMYHGRICTYLARIVGSAEEGEDLGQETFIKAWQSLPSMHDNLRFEAWFYRVATNTAIDYLRGQRLRKIFAGPHQDHAGIEQISGGGFELEERVAEAEYVQLALRQVSPLYRACLLLQIHVGFTQREIAALLNIGEKNISVYVRRGCEQFRQAYQQLEKGQDKVRRRRLAQ